MLVPSLVFYRPDGTPVPNDLCRTLDSVTFIHYFDDEYTGNCVSMTSKSFVFYPPKSAI